MDIGRGTMTVRASFRLNRRALWEQQISVAVEFDKLANAVAEGDEATAQAVLGWLLLNQPYTHSQFRERYLLARGQRSSFGGITQ